MQYVDVDLLLNRYRKRVVTLSTFQNKYWNGKHEIHLEIQFIFIFTFQHMKSTPYFGFMFKSETELDLKIFFSVRGLSHVFFIFSLISGSFGSFILYSGNKRKIFIIAYFHLLSDYKLERSIKRNHKRCRNVPN